jgi:formylglycine-generating enzyme required for sulfatase activity
LACNPSYATWTPSAGGNEKLPINCVNSWEAYAFCIWDGGFLATEAEWNIAAAAGTEQRFYPWGSAPLDSTRATYSGGPGFVGAKSPTGDGKYGHADLAGNMSEWMLDYDGTYPLPCVDCANLDAGGNRARRGGDWEPGAGFDASQTLSTPYRIAIPPNDARHDVGIRCARPK